MLKDEASPSASLLSSPYDTSAHTKRRGRPSSTGLSCCLRTPACPHSLAKTRPPLQPPFVELALGHVHTYAHTEKDERPMQLHRPLFFDKPLLKVPKLVSRIRPVRASSELAVCCRPKQVPQAQSPRKMHSCGFPHEGPDAGQGSAAPLFTAASLTQSRCSAVSCFWTLARPGQPSEPILFPRLRIRLVDFLTYIGLD
ncbi:hypothetical protein HPB50_003665 [Hyalomma asiaticum]|uniref:Uncharacterized protein n=1 Tax=Hyalomma asiaticum TaxID=266040 RepID=A0ACB7TC51_HYAAI|nr:hypothetical protein HPB50_003665 [Hyalomma asiaticum]